MTKISLPGGPPKRKTPLARGYSHYQKKRIMASFDEDVFYDIRLMAVENRCSFAEALRQLVEWGLEAKNSPAHHERSVPRSGRR